jgi:2-polyprenyl-3-methyl-5-hydroxy-6-metoxy-1,4-benzoquinol methylase
VRIGDTVIQLWRLHVAKDWIPQGSRVLDIGCHQGELFRLLGQKIAPSVGLDPLYKGPTEMNGHRYLPERFYVDLPFQDGSFDVIVLLATIEHMQHKDAVARESKRLLRQGGRVVITVPSLLVDKLLSVLLHMGFVDGMSLDEHHGFSPEELPAIFIPEGFKLKSKKKFQLGLNNLYVFERL